MFFPKELFPTILVTWHAAILQESKMTQPIRGQGSHVGVQIAMRKIHFFMIFTGTRERFVERLVTGYTVVLMKKNP